MKKHSIATQCVMIAMGMAGVVQAGTSNWTGVYAGVDAGAVFNDAHLTSQHLAFTRPNETCGKSTDFSVFSAGAQLGYLYQFPNTVVTGIEVNTTINTNQKNTSTCNSQFNPAVYDQLTFKNELQTSIKERVGRAMSWNQYNFLPYLTAGASFTNIGLSYQNESSDYYYKTTTRAGWLIGAGVEWAFMQHWSLRAEYSYVDYGNAINLNIPTIYGLLDTNGKAQVNLKSNNIALAINYWI